MRALLEPRGAIVLYLAAVGAEPGVAHARGFLLGPAAVVEDPATGSAAGPVLAYLRDRSGTSGLTVHQGDDTGRPSRIDCAWGRTVRACQTTSSSPRATSGSDASLPFRGSTSAGPSIHTCTWSPGCHAG